MFLLATTIVILPCLGKGWRESFLLFQEPKKRLVGHQLGRLKDTLRICGKLVSELILFFLIFLSHELCDVFGFWFRINSV